MKIILSKEQVHALVRAKENDRERVLDLGVSVFTAHLCLHDQLENPVRSWNWNGRWLFRVVKGKKGGNLDTYLLINDPSHEIHFKETSHSFLIRRYKDSVHCANNKHRASPMAFPPLPNAISI